jgi:hypothetical protein
MARLRMGDFSVAAAAVGSACIGSDGGSSSLIFAGCGMKGDGLRSLRAGATIVAPWWMLLQMEENISGPVSVVHEARGVGSQEIDSQAGMCMFPKICRLQSSIARLKQNVSLFVAFLC